MASHMTNRGKARLLAGGIAGKTFRLIPVNTPPASAAVAADLNTPSQITVNELAGGWRRTLANVAVAEDDAADRATIDADDPAPFVAINAGTLAGAWLVERAAGGADDDPNDHLIAFLDTNDLATNGGDVQLTVPVGGFILAT